MGAFDSKHLNDRLMSMFDKLSGGLITTSFEHHEIHDGDHFFISGVQDLSINNVLDFTFVTPNTTEHAHFTFKIMTESETAWSIYEGATISSALANTATPLNNNRNSSGTSTCVAKYEKHADLATANAKTGVGGATLLQNGISDAGKDSGFADRSREIILKANTTYCFRATATAAGYINFDMEWYEHTSENA